MESRCFSVLAILHVMTGRISHADKAFEVAYQSDCACCRPVIDRRFSYLLHEQNEHKAAVIRAARAVDSASGLFRGVAIYTLAEMKYHSGDIAGAIRDATEAVRLLPVSSVNHSPALTALVLYMAHSDSAEDIAEAFGMMPDLHQRFYGIKRKTQERAKLAWVTGGLIARHAVLSDLKGWELRTQLGEAQQMIEKGVTGLERLNMPLDAAAARADLAAVSAMMDPLKVERVLAGIHVSDLETLKGTVVGAAQKVLSPERVEQLWQALRELREATVKIGCDPPLVPYRGFAQS